MGSTTGMIHFTNTSKMNDRDVRWAIAFASDIIGIDLDIIHINVKNCKTGYRGMAYRSVPAISPVRKKNPSARYLVTIGVNPDQPYPLNNYWAHFEKFETIEDAEARIAFLNNKYDFADARIEHTWEDEPFEISYRKPYGGFSSPAVEYHNAKEALVGVIAHELQHIKQFKNHLKASEVEAVRMESFAVKAYREHVGQ